MGMYTECHVDAYLRADTPQEVIRMLRLMASNGDVGEMYTLAQIMGARLFTLNRWQCCLIGSSCSFPTDAKCILAVMADNRTHLHATWNQKNYDDEIEAFWEWLSPWVDCKDDDVVGHEHYEEADTPTPITGAYLNQLYLNSLGCHMAGPESGRTLLATRLAK